MMAVIEAMRAINGVGGRNVDVEGNPCQKICEGIFCFHSPKKARLTCACFFVLCCEKATMTITMPPFLAMLVCCIVFLIGSVDSFTVRQPSFGLSRAAVSDSKSLALAPKGPICRILV